LAATTTSTIILSACSATIYIFIQTSPETSQSLVNSTEQFGKLLGATLNNDTTEVIKTKKNIGMQGHWKH